MLVNGQPEQANSAFGYQRMVLAGFCFFYVKPRNILVTLFLLQSRDALFGPGVTSNQCQVRL